VPKRDASNDRGARYAGQGCRYLGEGIGRSRFS